MMNIEEQLAKANAYHTGKHFVYSRDDHGEEYVNLCVFNLSEHQKTLSALSLALIEKIVKEADIDVAKPVTIIGPDTLGAIIAETGAARFNSEYGTSFKSMHFAANKLADSGEKVFTLSRAPDDFFLNEQVLWVDDLLNASSTLARTRQWIEAFTTIKAVGVIADRSGMTAQELGVEHLVSLIEFTLERFSETDCPFCKSLRPIVTNLGHGKRFQEKNPTYAGGFVCT